MCQPDFPTTLLTAIKCLDHDIFEDRATWLFNDTIVLRNLDKSACTVFNKNEVKIGYITFDTVTKDLTFRWDWQYYRREIIK